MSKLSEKLASLTPKARQYIMLGGDVPRDISKTFQAEAKRAPRQREPERPRGRSSGPDLTPR